jgi:4-hydroxy-2-oxoheptanedioate aldolase
MRSGETLGGWCGIPSAFTAELVARAGFDWVCVDMQHGLVGYEQMVAMLQGIDAAGVPGLVRVRANRPDEIGRALDAGAVGVIVPLVDSPEEAAAAARACRYPPDGIRSWGPTRAALGRPGFRPETANGDVLCFVMVETPGALERIEEIVATPGIDGVFVGPNDLAISLGLGLPPLTDTAERHREAIARVGDACRRAGIVAAIVAYLDIARQLAEWRPAGYTMFAISSDVGMLAGSVRDHLALARGSA